MGLAIGALSLAFGDTWLKRIIGLAFGVGLVAHALLTAPKEIAARNAKRSREARKRRTRTNDEEP